MQTKRNSKLTGIALALAAAGLAGCAAQGGGAGATVDLVHCYGVNQCNGHNDCKTADNACAGQASCKGQGFVAMPSKACKDVGGNRKDSWEGNVAVADLTRCYGVNVCKGHNDCRTAANACGGHGSCKGHGFVAMPAKACTDIGGKSKT